MAVVALTLIIAFSNLILGKLIVGPEREKLWGIGRKIEIWGNMLLLAAALTALIVIMIRGTDSGNIKWLLLFAVIISFSFEALIQWRFLKGSKEYIVSLLLLLIGAAYVIICL
ncbi:DUF4181 domain-containing protein [Paenibacillus sp.]|jgi:ABC-type Fe3+-siderophore transport system permease subunit|uniref:DUF4181 domain-containing protein n=1 Tax=Paenibacillus sp. TaxID=58172 RepID=UPI002826EEF1|nr:DUF4181 domain-containing protein [Paenibacillus sp.]MDR0269428.1 DUF4181 domain-containing protein [Paenibacillus sp.]